MSRQSGDFDPDAFLDQLEPIGWRLGLGRMNALCDELGRPQDSFGTIHVVGTNGKSSVARMTAAVLGAQGLVAGCLVSPHLSSWSERVLVAGCEVEPEAFAESVRIAAKAAEAVNAGLEPKDLVTQFEIATAAGFHSLAEAGVEAAAIEAGLGGRLDATNTIGSSVTVLASIGLDHTEWLGETELEIASEKLAVLRPRTVLVLGPVAADVRELALETAADRNCAVLEPGDGLPPGVEPDSPALYQRGNLALAIAAAGQYLEASDPPAERHNHALHGGRHSDMIRPEALKAASAAAAVPGRLERVGEDPPIFIDVAHNRPAAAALAESVPGVAGASPVIAVIAILDDKDAHGIVAELAAVVEHAVFTDLPPELLTGSARPGARGHPPQELLEIAVSQGLEAEVLPLPSDAIERAREIALGRAGLVLLAGSHYLPRPERGG